ncbi:uncharacterized protein ASPGLDRAFT_490487 [Aspergillus glaucus CBS 516.65]|uniref:Uncharacterized protein n=1 Tax=Aspergillus glaucus CBS 516.65 TaxID=1160497 RepID=A0A1L9VFR4_ASPGL|nr:hypothetical protein ASPGLDRAFT_490487 [Aspergillus glaucus CBS 516.65]OJJ82749.1 hypothetical protein ASPGLDRAFT_490487 [Aspergillus glaucus CBS 516.65]
MYHDLLDVLYNVAKPEQIGRGGPPRDGFQGFAKELQIRLIGGNGKLKRLHHLSIPQDEFRDLVKLRLVTHFGGRPNDQIQQDGDLDRVADCIVRAFAQDPNLGITWEMFDQASKTMPDFLASYHRLLSCLYKPDEKDIKHRLPKPGHIATLPIFAQLGILLWETVSFAHVQLHKSYIVLKNTSSINTATLGK